jgi:hypothetical protein
MAHGREQFNQTEERKKPQKTLAEKRKEKREKKENR